MIIMPVLALFAAVGLIVILAVLIYQFIENL